jgi:soluble lytic murein transglycosylase-like protein
VRRTTAVATIAAACLIGLPDEAKSDCQTRACEQRVAAKQCSQSRVVPCIRRAALRYRVSYQMLLRKARCESNLNPYARNPSGSSGLFQFLPSTWATTPYAGRSIWSARWNALAAGWMHAAGRGGEWVCQ